MPSSYQDVDWGYGDCGAPTTDNPLSLPALNEYLARYGYQMKASDPYSPIPIIQWENKKGGIPITLAAPQFRADGHDRLVYDLNDIRDMLAHWHNGGIEVGDGHELVATRRAPAPSVGESAT
jgi:hypothetical protein